MEWIVPPQVAWKGSPFTFVSELFGKSWLPRQGCLLFLQHLEVKALEDSLSFYGLSQNWMPNIRDTGDVFKIHVSASKESVISLALRVNQGLHYHLPGIDLSNLSIQFFFPYWELLPFHLKEAFYALSLAYSNCQYHYSCTLTLLWSKVTVTWTQVLS